MVPQDVGQRHDLNEVHTPEGPKSSHTSADPRESPGRHYKSGVRCTSWWYDERTWRRGSNRTRGRRVRQGVTGSGRGTTTGPTFYPTGPTNRDYERDTVPSD